MWDWVIFQNIVKSSYKFPEVLQDRVIVCWLDEAGGWYLKEKKDF